jgi:hypothetical protein
VTDGGRWCSNYKTHISSFLQYAPRIPSGGVPEAPFAPRLDRLLDTVSPNIFTRLTTNVSRKFKPSIVFRVLLTQDSPSFNSIESRT